MEGHQKDITREEVAANVTAREASAPVYITGDDGKIITYYPNEDGTYHKQTRTGGAEHDRAGNVKIYQRSHVTDADGDLQDAFVQI